MQLDNKHLISIDAINGKTLNITWQTSNTCNYRCSYCNPGNWGGDIPNLNLDVYKRNLDKLVNGVSGQQFDKIKLFLSGGEPSHWPILVPICEYVSSLLPGKVTIAVNTNLSRPLHWWERNYHWFDDVVASYHPGWVKHDRFLENALFLQDKVNYLAVRIMMAEDYWDQMLTQSDVIWNAMHNITMEYVPILDEMSVNADPYDYKDKSKIEWLMKNSNRSKQSLPKPDNRVGHSMVVESYTDGTTQPVNSNRLTAERRNFFLGWHCDIGTSINIAINGDITLGSCGVSGIIGNINDAHLNINNLQSTIICPRTHCHCGTDMSITKRERP